MRFMGIRYLFGRSCPAKTQYIIDEIKSELLMNHLKNIVVLVPEQFTLHAEQALIKGLTVPGIINVQVLSISRLVQIVKTSVGGITHSRLNPSGKFMVIRSILNDISEQLRVYGSICRQEGFIINIDKIITEFKQLNISPEDLWEEATKCQDNTLLAHKLIDIHLIYSHYSNYCKDQFIDNEDEGTILCEKIHLLEDISSTKFWVHFFPSYLPHTIQVLKRISILAEEIIVSINYDRMSSRQASEVSLFCLSVYQQLHKFAQENHIKEMLEDMDAGQCNSSLSTEISHIADEFFAYPYAVFQDEPRDILVYESRNRFEEIQIIANRIHVMVSNNNWRWRDIAIICNDITSYQPHIKQQFKQIEIPYFIDQNRSIMNHPLIRFILSTFDILVQGFRYDHIVSYIKTGLTTLSIEDGEALENYALKYGISGNQWKRAFVKGEADKLEYFESLRLIVVEPLLRLEAALNKNHESQAMTRELYQYISFLSVHDILENDLAELFGQGKYEEVSEYSQIWNILLDVMDQIYEFMGNINLSIKEYKGIIETGMKVHSISVIPPTLDQVFIGDVKGSINEDIRVLFIIGANDGVLPAITNQAGLLPEDETQSLSIFAKNSTVDRSVYNIEEDYFIYQKLCLPKEKLIISYAQADNEGKSLKPSLLINRFKQLFPQLKIQRDWVQAENTSWSSAGAALELLLKALRTKTDGIQIAEHWQEVFDWYRSQNEWQDQLSLIVQGIGYSNQFDKLSSNIGDEKKELVLSASRLESFNNCPFAYFIQYLIRPQERKEYKIAALEMGDLFHRGIKEFFNRIETTDALRKKDIAEPVISQLTDEVFTDLISDYREQIFTVSDRNAYMGKRLKQIAEHATAVLWNHLVNSEFLPVAWEIAFGRDSILPPLSYKLNSEVLLSIEGIIDRVDICDSEDNSYVRIIDYKTGDSKLKLDRVYYGFDLQLFLYLKAVLQGARGFKRKALIPAGVYYFQIDDPWVENSGFLSDTDFLRAQKHRMKGYCLDEIEIIKKMDSNLEKNSNIIPVSINSDHSIAKNSYVISQTNIMKLNKHIDNMICALGEEIWRGTIKIHPQRYKENTACQYCGFGAICQFDPSMNENKYRNLKPLTSQEVLGIIGEEAGCDLK